MDYNYSYQTYADWYYWLFQEEIEAEEEEDTEHVRY